MARTVYYIRSHEADGTNEYTQITGTEFSAQNSIHL